MLTLKVAGVGDDGGEVLELVEGGHVCVGLGVVGGWGWNEAEVREKLHALYMWVGSLHGQANL